MRRILSILVFGMLTLPTAAQTFRIVHTFTNSPDGANPAGSLLIAGDTLYGTTFGGGTSSTGTVFKVNTDGTGFFILKHFMGSDGAWPRCGLVLNGDTLYGTTYVGGTNGNGTVFKIDTNGNGFAVLRHLKQTDGLWPVAGLLLNGGTLYGTASILGNNIPISDGTVFKVDTTGANFSALYTFKGGTNGDAPYAPLLINGNTLYGSTRGSSIPGTSTIFKIQTDGSGFATLKTFTNNPDGRLPTARLVLIGDKFYGTAYSGGAGADSGTIFRMDTNGSSFAVLRTFSATVSDVNSDGAGPMGELVLSGDTLYGTTFYGGSSSNGVIYKIKTDGSGFSEIKYFSGLVSGTNSDGANPQGGLTLSGSTLYGTARYGGAAGNGVVFALTLPPQILVRDGNFGVRSNSFGFSITGLFGQTAIIESSTNWMSSSWTPLQTNTLGTNAVYFSDSSWTNFAQRFYRARASQ